MIWVGLTGGIASGKSTVARFLQDFGYLVIDADAISHQLIEPGAPAFGPVLHQFGTSILDPKGKIDRQQLGQKVFHNPEDLKKLENILHPLIRTKVQELKKEAQIRGEKIAFYDVPLLFEKNLQSEFDTTVLISCSEIKQIERLRKRNNLSEKEARLRLQTQMTLLQKEKLADLIVQNEGNFDQLRKKIERLVESIKKSQKS